MPDSDRTIARRWAERVRFVLDGDGRLLPEWREAPLIPANIRERFADAVAERGPSIELLRQLETDILDYAAQLRSRSGKLSQLLDELGFVPFEPPLA